MKDSIYILIVFYEGFDITLDIEIERAIGYMRSTSRFFCGWRELTWEFDHSIQAKAAQNRVENDYGEVVSTELTEFKF